MQAWIALLRGINVGGKHLLPMHELTEHLEALGCESVKTYIQSGNAVFRTKKKSPAALAKKIAARIETHHGFCPHVLILSAQALEQAVSNNPFPEGESEPKTLHLFFLSAPPGNNTEPDLSGLDALKSPTERFHLTDDVLYLHAPDGIGRSKLAAKAEKRLAVPVTARNWRTVQKLEALVASLG